MRVEADAWCQCILHTVDVEVDVAGVAQAELHQSLGLLDHELLIDWVA